MTFRRARSKVSAGISRAHARKLSALPHAISVLSFAPRRYRGKKREEKKRGKTKTRADANECLAIVYTRVCVCVCVCIYFSHVAPFALAIPCLHTALRAYNARAIRLMNASSGSGERSPTYVVHLRPFGQRERIGKISPLSRELVRAREPGCKVRSDFGARTIFRARARERKRERERERDRPSVSIVVPSVRQSIPIIARRDSSSMTVRRRRPLFAEPGCFQLVMIGIRRSVWIRR